LEILAGNDSKAAEVDNNKLIEVNTPRLKRTIGDLPDLPTLKKNLWALPDGLSSDLTELSQLKREQMTTR